MYFANCVTKTPPSIDCARSHKCSHAFSNLFFALSVDVPFTFFNILSTMFAAKLDFAVSNFSSFESGLRAWVLRNALKYGAYNLRNQILHTHLCNCVHLLNLLIVSF